MREFFAMLLCVIMLAGCADHSTHRSTPDGTDAFWEATRFGANFFNAHPSRERFDAAADAHIEFARLVPDKWETQSRDMLIGSADEFTAIPPSDLAHLQEVLDDAHASGVRVVLTMLSLPGCRNRQFNEDRFDGRLWSDRRYWDQAAAFWKQLASSVGDHPAIVAYTPLNEPHPARALADIAPGDPAYAEWFEASQGTPADINAFNRFIVGAIRSVDPDTTIILEGPGFASNAGIAYLEPVDDPNTLYAFHFYEPWRYTTWRVNGGRFSYPDAMPKTWRGTETVPWPRTRIAEQMAKVARWAESHEIPPNRVIAAEFGVDRRAPGAALYLHDCARAINTNAWHAAFYAFREDTWHGMDYELGAEEKLPGYWQAVEAGNPDPAAALRSQQTTQWQALRPSAQ